MRSADSIKLIFVSLTNILLITSLISLLSNSLAKVGYSCTFTGAKAVLAKLIGSRVLKLEADWLRPSANCRNVQGITTLFLYSLPAPICGHLLRFRWWAPCYAAMACGRSLEDLPSNDISKVR